MRMNFKITKWLSLVGVIFLIITVFFDLDIFEFIASHKHHLEELDIYEVDELILFLFFPCIGLLADFLIFQHKAMIREKRMEVLQATMVNVCHVVNNLANSLQLIKLEYEDTGTISQESLVLLDDIIKNSSEEINHLATMEEIPDKLDVEEGITIIKHI